MGDTERTVTYTAIFGGYDALLSREVPGEFVCFTDWPQGEGSWDVRVVARTEPTPRLENRKYKALPHRFLPDADYWLYIDGNVMVRTEPSALVEKYLQDAPLALFRHHRRDCIYEEAKALLSRPVRRGVDPPRVRALVERYRAEGYPEHYGLCAGTVLLRKNTPEVREFNEMWWEEIRSGDGHDQCSLNYCLWRLGLPYATLDRPYPHSRVPEMNEEFAHYLHGAKPKPALEPWHDQNNNKHWGFVHVDNRVVMDVGADYGSTAYWFLMRGARRVIAVECAPEYVEDLQAFAEEVPAIEAVDKKIATAEDFRWLIETYEPSVMKVDCEGCECRLAELDDKTFSRVRAYAIELHRVHAARRYENPYTIHGLKKLQKRFRQKFERCKYTIKADKRMGRRCVVIYAVRK